MRPRVAYHRRNELRFPSARAPPDAAATRPAPELSVVVPTFKERDNVPLLVEKLARTLAGIDWEVVFVDDNSPDGTAAAARHDRRDRRARALHAPHRAARPRRRLHRGHAGEPGALRRRDGRRPAARRDAAHRDAGAGCAAATDLAVASRYVDGRLGGGPRRARGASRRAGSRPRSRAACSASR